MEPIKKTIIPYELSRSRFSKFFHVYLIATLCLLLFFLFDQSSVPLPIAFFVTMLFLFPVGYAALLPLQRLIVIPNFIKLVLCLSIGLTLNFLWSYFISPYTIHPIANFSLFAISIFIILFNHHKQKLNDGWDEPEKFQRELVSHNNKILFHLSNEENNKFNIIKKEVPFFSLLILFFVIIMLMFSNFGWWPPYGDYELHSMFTAIQIYEGNLTLEVPFFTEGEIIYPLGAHVTSANLSILYNISPPETLLMLSGIIMFLILGILMSLVFTLTKSFWLALIVLISLFTINQGIIDTDGSLWGQFVIGVIPNLAGFFFLFLLFLVLLTIKQDNISSKIFLILITISGIVVYPVTLIYSLMIITIFFISKILTGDKKHKLLKAPQHIFLIKNKNHFLNLYFFFVIIIVIGMLDGEILGYIVNLADRVGSDSETIKGIFSGTSPNFFDDFVSISIIVGILSSLYITIYRKKERFFGIFTLSFILIELSANYLGFFESFLWSRRYSQLIPIFSWISLSILVYYTWIIPQNKIIPFVKNSKSTNKGKEIKNLRSSILIPLIANIKKINFLKYFVIGCFATFTLFFLVPDIPTFYENGTPTGFKPTVEALPYLDGMKWVVKNVDSKDIIFSYVSLEDNYPQNRYFVWIPGIEFKQIINRADLPFPVDATTRIKIKATFANFQYEGSLAQILKENEVKYIITTYDENRNVILEEYDFLDVVFKDDYTVVYKVLSELISTEENIKKDLAAIAFSGDYKAATRLYNQIVEFDSKAFSDAWEGKNTILIKLGDDNEGKIIFQRLYEFEIEEIYAYEIFSEFVLSGIMHQALIKNEVTYVITFTDDISHKIFQTYDFLDVVSKDDYTTVYKVIPRLISTEEESIKKDILFAKTLELEGHPQLALKVYEKIRKFDSTSFEAWSNEIRLSNMLNDYEQTKSIYDEMINEFLFLRNLHSQDLEKYRLYTSQYYDALEGKARLAIKFSEYRDALRAYEEIVFDQRYFDVDFLIKKGQVLELMEEFIKAKDIYEDILRREPENSLVRERIKNIDEYLIQK